MSRRKSKILSMKHIEMYTDGACSGNPGPGGWGTILVFRGMEKEMSGFVPGTTNNRMEIFAVIQGLRALKEPCQVDVYSDSAYVVNAFNEHWIENWQRRGWKKADRSAVENQDLWNQLLISMRTHEVIYHKVKGHADHPYNNRCDALATSEIKKNRELSSANGLQTLDFDTEIHWGSEK